MGCAAPWTSGETALLEFNATSFTEFFIALWDKPPFVWQKELAERVLERETTPVEDSFVPDSSVGSAMKPSWPEVIALPTASGKTACMDIAVFALAAQASRLAWKQTITAPRRVFFVVDRRVIVDEAYERARQLAEKLRKAEKGILKTVADNLRRLAHGEMTSFDDEQPLAAHVLRGGMYRSEAWARSPLQPTVIASTVDQIGSRLLFRAYGRGSGMWPIYAGLVANDSLVLLDEAHCAKPFLQTLQAVRHFRTWAHAPLGRSFHPVVMSATPPPGLEDVFEDQSAESRDPLHALGQRQLAHKPALLRTLKKITGNRGTSLMARELAEAASGLVNEERRAIVVFVNRVATARQTYRLLNEQGDVDAVLLTGRMRSLDKDVVIQQRLKPLQSSQSGERALEMPLIVVATQALEVGADLDFDGLVTECASLDALRQRFGRLNRMGRPIEARAVILVRGDQVGSTKNDDPVYGRALAETWAWLNDCKDKNGEVDFGIAHLAPMLPNSDAMAVLNAPSFDAPVMLPSHVDCWAQTSPTPLPSPDIATFLHGPREGAADVQVCWRADLDLTNEEGREHAVESLSLCPPSSNETLPVPVGIFKRWLAGEDTDDYSPDVEGVRTETDIDEKDSSIANNEIIRWRGAETKHTEDITSEPAKIQPGDVIVIPTDPPRSWHRLGDLPPDSDLDVGDRAYRLARAKPILRLHPKLVDAWPESVMPKETARELLNDLELKYDDDPTAVTDALHDLLTELVNFSESLPERWSWLPKTASELGKEYSGYRLHVVSGKSLVLVGRRRIPELTHEADSFSDEDDTTASGISHGNGHPVKLRAHLSGVEVFARRYASGCGLPDDLAEALACAGLLHDLGKADPRFQSLLRGGAHWLGGELFAKSAGMPKTRDARNRVRADSGYPEGSRHELLSVRMAENAPVLLPDSDELRALVLHLIASHHGYCRPFAPVVFDEQGVEVSFELRGQRAHWCGPTDLERLDSGIADRYWRLVRHHGWWGLAWLEALLRLADWRRSEWEETHGDVE